MFCASLIAVADVLDARPPRVDGTVLLPLMVREFTLPEKRINSVPAVDGNLLLAHHAEVPLGSSSSR